MSKCWLMRFLPIKTLAVFLVVIAGSCTTQVQPKSIDPVLATPSGGCGIARVNEADQLSRYDQHW